MDNQSNVVFQKCHNQLLLECKNIVLPKGTTLTLHGCPVTLMADTVVNSDPKNISFAFDSIEKNNSTSLVKVDVTGQLALIKSLNSEIDF